MDDAHRPSKRAKKDTDDLHARLLRASDEIKKRLESDAKSTIKLDKKHLRPVSLHDRKHLQTYVEAIEAALSVEKAEEQQKRFEELKSFLE